MAREILILWAGRHQRGSWEQLCGEYRKRLGRWVTLTDRPIKAATSGDDERRRALEGERFLAALPQPCWLIALDSGGKAVTSESWAEELRALQEEWTHPVVFAIGSDLGLDPALLAQARRTLSFGPMTLPHELARLVLYEQLYRALSIQAGINYHRPRF
jgi:23S rRNA (pseudouridine1915-N3)-methyltransferase